MTALWMTARFHGGQILKGQRSLYNVLRPLRSHSEDIWLATPGNAKTVLIKIAPLARIENELQALKLCRGHRSIRQLVDVVDHPKSLVLDYLDTNLFYATYERKLEKQDVKRAVKTALDGLIVLHAHNRAHTGLFEAILLYNASSMTIFYLTRRHIFAPNILKPEDEEFPLAVVALQHKFFGPYPEKFLKLLDQEATMLFNFIIDRYGNETQDFLEMHPSWIDQDAKDFISYLMKPDPRDRPSAIEALTHPWLKDVVEGSPEGTEKPADGAMGPTHGTEGPGEEPSSPADQTAQSANEIAGSAGERQDCQSAKCYQQTHRLGATASIMVRKIFPRVISKQLYEIK
ncbi:MAG: hypothetical protein Q9181_000806 [Wetmoreana brouardii]